MKSGWIIKYKDGGMLFFTEEAYLENEKQKNLDDISCEEHWFSVEKLKEKYPWVK
jgi:hypothetical protein